MSHSIPSSPRRHSQSETDTETSSLVSTTSSSEQSSSSEDDSEKVAQAPVLKARQAKDTAKATGDDVPQAIMTSTSPAVKNRQTAEQKRARYGQARQLPAYQRDTNIQKVKTEKHGGGAEIQQIPKPDGRWDKFIKAVSADGYLNIKIVDENEVSEFLAWLRTSPSSLRELYFRNSSNGSAHAIELAEALRDNTFLIKLEILGDFFGADDVATIADALKINTALTELQLYCYFIGDEGAKAVAEALKINTTLTTLDIGCDFMGDEGVKAMADALKINKTLTKLELFAYEITDEGEQAMVDALRVNEALTSLRFSPTLIGQFDTETSNLLERNRRLKFQPYAEASLDLIFKHSPVVRELGIPTDIIPVLAEQLSTEVMDIFAQELKADFRAPPPPIIATTTNTTTTTTTATTTDATIPTTLITSPAPIVTSPASVPPFSTQPTATAAEINALLADLNPVVALSRWIDGHANPIAALNWVDPANGYTLLHYAVITQQGAVIRDLMRRGIDRQKTDHNNQTAAQLAQARADSSSSRVVADIATLLG